MHFQLNETQRLIKETARSFSQKQLAPYAAKWDREGSFPKKALKDMADLGFLGLLIPEDYNGIGTDNVSYASVIEEIAQGDASCSTIVAVHNSVGCLPIYQYGSKEQKDFFLPKMTSGEWLGAFCLTEPQAGSEASAIKTYAEKKGDHYILNGTKQFITSGSTAQIAIVFACTDKNNNKNSISAFIVPTDTKGYVVSRVEEKLGQRASDTCQITFDNCSIPESYRLGEEGQGYKIALSNLESGRIGIASQCVGIAQAALDQALSYAQERSSFGKTLHQHQAVSFSLSEMATEIEAARLLVYQAALRKDLNLPTIKEASMAKLYASKAAEKTCSKAIHIFGGYGYLNDFPVERLYRDAKVCQIYEGTNEVQKMVISRELYR